MKSKLLVISHLLRYKLCTILVAFLIGSDPVLADVNIFWDSGTHIQDQDQKFKFKFGGQLHAQLALYRENERVKQDLEAAKNSFGLRYLRLNSSGEFFGKTAYKAEIDFAGSSPKLSFAYVSLLDLPVLGRLDIGFMKEPFSMEMVASSTDVIMLERSVLSTFTKSRNLGFLSSKGVLNRRLNWSLGYFAQTSSSSVAELKNYSLGLRTYATPFFKKHENKLIHIGLAYNFRRNVDEQVKYSTAPETRFTSAYINSSLITSVPNQHKTGVEIAAQYKRLAFQSEINHLRVSGEYNAANFMGYYAQFSYIVIGKPASYSLAKGVFKRSKMKGFKTGESKGVFELAFRSSFIDLSNAGQSQTMYTNYVAMNWYMNPALRFGANFGFAITEDSYKTFIAHFKSQIVF